MGRGPARPINFSDDGPRPGLAYPFLKIVGPAHHIFKFRPGPAHHILKLSARLGPARPITFSIFSARPDLDHDNFQMGPAQPASTSPHDMP